MIHPDHQASVRVAHKAGFQMEGASRGIWYNRGRNHDLAVFVALRADLLPGGDPGPE